MTEKIERFFANIFGVVPVFEHRTRRQFIPNFGEIVHQLVVIFCGMKILVHVRHFGRFEHLENQHRVVSRERASALSDDVGMRNIVLIGRLDQGVNNVVDVFLYTIVDRTFRVGRARAVIVHAQSATTIDKFDVEAHFAQLHIVLCHLAQRNADETDFGNLTTDVEVNEPKAIAQALLFEQCQGLKQFRAVEPEL